MEGLKRVSIRGKSYPVFYGMLGLSHVMKQTGIKNLDDVFSQVAGLQETDGITPENIDFLYEFIYAGFLFGAKYEGEELDLNLVQLSAHIPLNSAAINTIFEAFAESMPQMEEDQKKAPAKTKRKAAKAQV